MRGNENLQINNEENNPIVYKNYLEDWAVECIITGIVTLVTSVTILLSLWFFKILVVKIGQFAYIIVPVLSVVIIAIIKKKIRKILKSRAFKNYARYLFKSVCIFVCVLTIKLLLVNKVSPSELKSSDFMTLMVVWLTSLRGMFKYIYKVHENQEYIKEIHIWRSMKKLANAIKVKKDNIIKYPIISINNGIKYIKESEEFRINVSVIYHTIFFIYCIFILAIQGNIIDIILAEGTLCKDQMNQLMTGNIFPFFANINLFIWFIKFFVDTFGNVVNEQIL